MLWKQEIMTMGKYKENARYNVLSIRVTDEEKAYMDEISRYTRKTVSMLMREAIQLYTPHLKMRDRQR
jgi:predicted transcriptional regulator